MNKNVKVKLLKNMSWHDTSKKEHKKGDVVEIAPELAKLWIERKCAESVKK